MTGAAAAIDIGGKSIKPGFVTEQGLLYRYPSKAIEPNLSEKEFFTLLHEEVQQLLQRTKMMNITVHAIGLGIPGLINPAEGIAVTSANLPWHDGTNFKELFAGWTDIPVFVQQDVRCGAIGEKQFGALKPYKHFLYVAIGTGIGAAIGINDEIYTGSSGKGGELGHMIVTPNGRRCGCGQKGCLEAYCSAKHIETIYLEETGKSLSCSSIVEALKKGDPDAQKIWDVATDALANVLLNYHILLEPEAIVIGGGVANAGEYLLNPIKEKMDATTNLLKLPRLKLSSLKDDSGLIGAGYQALERLRKQSTCQAH